MATDRYTTNFDRPRGRPVRRAAREGGEVTALCLIHGRRGGKRLAFAIWCVCVWLCSACAEPLPIHIQGLESRKLTPDVVEACDMIGLVCEAADPGYGSIEIEIVPLTPSGKPRVRGVTLRGGSCSPEIWVEPVPRLIAHEIAHALGLEHRESEDGLMRAVRQGFELSDEEMDEIERGGNRLVGCRL